MVFDAKKGTKAGRQSGQRIFQCCVNSNGEAPRCSKCGQCTAPTSRGNRCKNRTCRDTKYCWLHLRTLHKIVIKPSYIKGAGLGLFAMKRLKKRPRMAKGRRGKKNEEPVFKRGTRIIKYEGKHMTLDEVNALYDYEADVGPGARGDQKHRMIGPTAPYTTCTTIDGKEVCIDAACVRGAAAYANSIANVKSSHPARRRLNVKIKEGYMVATKNIYAGDELLLDYKNVYWDAVGPEYIKFTTKKVRARQ